MKLITSGCSFSDNREKTWPYWLQKELDVEHIQLASGGLGNGLISRKLIHEVSIAENKEDLLVGIMWSSCDRLDAYTEDPNFSNKDDSNYLRRGQIVFPSDDPGGWIQMYPEWTNSYSLEYYKTYSNTTWNVIQTYEHIIRTQLFLEKHNVKYFMMPYMDHVLELKGNAPSLRHLWNEINLDTFMSLGGCLEWCCDKSGLPWKFERSHPKDVHYKLYTEQVILPYLKDRGLIC